MDLLLELFKKANVTTLPINLVSITNCLGVEFSTYRDFASSKGISELEVIKRFHSDGFTITGGGKTIIVYNQNQSNLKRRRVTIAHEISHILLEHLVNYDNSELDLGIFYDKEADKLASDLLCPISVLHIMGVASPTDISRLCDVSFSAAENVYQRLLLRRKSNDFFTDKLEQEMVLNFLGYISNYHCSNGSSDLLSLSPTKLYCY